MGRALLHAPGPPANGSPTVDLKKLREQRQKLLDEAKALADKADQERRDLTADESQRFDKALAEADELERQISAKEADLTRRAKLTSALAQASRPEERLTEPEVPTQAHTVHATAPPAGVRRHRRLRHFHGPDAELKAYRAGQWALATLFGNEQARTWCQQNSVALAHSEGANTAGGWLVPDEFELAIIDLREEYGVFRREARVEPMARETKTIPRRTGGLTSYFIAENPASGITESDKAWDAVQLTARTLAILTRMSNEVAEDAVISLADDLAEEIAYAFSLKEDQCGFLGDGTSTYGGISGVVTKINDGNHAGSIVTAATTHTAFDTLTLTDFHKVTGKLPEHARANARWYVSRPGFGDSMERLAYAGGGNTVDSISGGKGLMFLGYPVVISQVLNSVLAADVSVIKLLFGDLRKAAVLGNRRGVTLATSEQRYFELNQLALRGTERFDIVVHDVGDASNAGPIVALKTPSS